MNDNAKKWVEALRSGKYKQGQQVLRTEDDRYCCLGVACELAADAGIIPPAELLLLNTGYEGRPEKKVYAYQGSRFYLPTEVVNWLKLRDVTAPYRTREGFGYSLSATNDSGTPFEDIANIIESEPTNLFVS